MAKVKCRRCDVVSKGNKRFGARLGVPQPLLCTNGKRKGAGLVYVVGKKFGLQGLLTLTRG